MHSMVLTKAKGYFQGWGVTFCDVFIMLVIACKQFDSILVKMFQFEMPIMECYYIVELLLFVDV